MCLSGCDSLFGDTAIPMGNGHGGGATGLSYNYKNFLNTWTMKYAILSYTDYEGTPLPDKTDSTTMIDLSIKFDESADNIITSPHKSSDILIKGDYTISLRNETKSFSRIKPLLYPYNGKFSLISGVPQTLQMEQQWQLTNNGEEMTLITEEYIKERDTLYWKTTKLVFN